MIFVLLFKGAITLAFTVIYPFTAEVYDTSMRVTGVGFNGSICRLGGIIMPWVVFNSFKISTYGPYLFIGILTMFSCIASIMIP